MFGWRSAIQRSNPFIKAKFYQDYRSLLFALTSVEPLNIEGLFAAHPLMTFGPELYTLEKYQQIHWAVTAPAAMTNETQASQLSDLLPHFKNPFFHLAPEHKALYHALCVVAGNIPQMMWSEVNQKMQRLEIPKEALHVYLRQVVENFNQFGPAAITGPLVRQDQNTIEKNLAALKQSSPYLEQIYKTTATAIADKNTVATKKDHL